MKILIALVVSGISLIPLFAEDVGYAGSGPARGLSRGLDPALKDAPYRNPALDIEKRIDDLVGRMTPFEKFKALHCRSTSSAGGIPRIGLSEFLTCDGGVGPRAENRSGMTYIPCGIASAASWDGELAQEIGRAFGEETRALYPAGEGRVAKILLGPGGNIGGRTPFGARSFEYLGEDPLLAGRLAGRFAKGLQSVKVSPCMKHYVCNDQEWCRTMINVTVGERALREIYARPFEVAIREGGVWSIMNSYNAVNGEWTSWNRRVNDILYRDNNWDGALLADWGGYRNDLRAIAGGTTLDTNCTDDPAQYRREVEDLKAGRISEADLNEQLRRVLRLFFRIGAFDDDTPEEKALQARCEKSFRSEAHRQIAYRAAAESFVLLENRGGFLPVDAAKVRTVAVMGPNADQYHTMIDGNWLGRRGGSAAVKAAREITPLEGFCQVFGERNVLFAPGFRFENGNRPNAVSVPALKAMDPLEAARKADLVVFCGGYDHSVDREVLGWGYFKNADREYLTLQPGPRGESQEELIRKVAAVNPNVVVAVTCGGPFTTESFRDAVKGVVVTWYGGEFGGRVLVDLILGDVNPSGRLPYTFGRQPCDWPSVAKGGRCYLGEITKPLQKYTEADCGVIRAEREYTDGIWVGYRAFDHFGTKPLYPFGYGLSYTTFALAKGDAPNTVKVSNTGRRSGRAVVQAYVVKPSVPGVEMPVKELADFASVELKPGETKSVTFKVGEDSLRYWDERANGWKRPAGEFRLKVGFDAATLPVELCMGPTDSVAAVSPQEFESPADRYHPWCYWWWLNGNVDRKTLTQDLEAMRETGFRGVIMFDSRGYWDDDDHVRAPSVRHEYLSESWSDHLVHAVNECARLGLEFSMSISCSGGSLRGPDRLGPDAPKRLVYQSFALKPGEAVPAFAAPAFAWYRPVAALAVRYAGEPRKTHLKWRNAGGLYTQVAHHNDRTDADAAEKDAEILEIVDLEKSGDWRATDGNWVVLRFGMTTIGGHEYDVDILDKTAVTRYFNRFSKAVLDRVAPHLGKTFTHLYSCSWEGAVPTWSVDFKSGYRELTGDDDIVSKLPLLCHFDRKGARAKFVETYRKARNELFRRNFYLTAKALAAKRGVRWVSESGGPWRRDPAIFGLADQVDFYAVNDLPQGEFWHRMSPGWGCGNGQFVRGAVRAAKELGINRVSAEAFTHMNHHWSVAPCHIKGDGDRAYASGVNHFVWHTFTCSPDEYGTPGGEYFAGTHINRNVPWRRDGAAFVAYLTRCQYLLQQGEPVLRMPPRREGYFGWGDRDEVFSDPADCRTPKGWRYAHRRCVDGTDIYFLTGEGTGEVRFAAKGPAEFWDPVTGKVTPAGEGPVLAVDLPKDGSIFAVFRKDALMGAPAHLAERSVVTLDGPWTVEFLPPERAVNVAPFVRTLEHLVDFTTLDDFEVRHFVGAAVYRRAFECPADVKSAALSLGEVKLGTARVVLNGRDLGVAWCAPWRVEIPEGVLKSGRNELEIRFTNNWANRLIGDTQLPPEKRVGRTFVAVRDAPRKSPGKTYTIHSGYCRDDALFPCGVLGPVRLMR